MSCKHGALLVVFVAAALLMVSNGMCLYADMAMVECTIRDSLSHDSIPAVSVAISDMNKSFITRNSGFVGMLPVGVHSLVLEAEGYEPLRMTIDVKPDDNSFWFGMVKASDRQNIDVQKDTVLQCLRSFNRALLNRNIDEARAYLSEFDRIGISDVQRDSLRQEYVLIVQSVIDSLIHYAKALEDSNKFADAYYYYGKILSIDSTHTHAKDKQVQMDKKLVGQPIPAATSTKTTLTPEQIESLYHEGISCFLSEKYDEARAIFKKILRQNPAHEGATNYLARTEARLKILNR